MLFWGVPNCVNLRERIAVPLGAGKWMAVAEWYEKESFRGHDREPDVGDLRYIARDLGLRDVRIFGRNWLGHASRRSWVRALTPMADRVLRPFPCSAGHSLGAQMSLPLIAWREDSLHFSACFLPHTRILWGRNRRQLRSRRLLSSRTTPPSRKPCHIMT